MRGYTIFIHYDPDSESWLVDVPDLPGVATFGETPEEARKNPREAIGLHVDGLREDGLPVPEPKSYEMLVV